MLKSQGWRTAEAASDILRMLESSTGKSAVIHDSYLLWVWNREWQNKYSTDIIFETCYLSWSYHGSKMGGRCVLLKMSGMRKGKLRCELNTVFALIRISPLFLIPGIYSWLLGWLTPWHDCSHSWTALPLITNLICGSDLNATFFFLREHKGGEWK